MAKLFQAQYPASRSRREVWLAVLLAHVLAIWLINLYWPMQRIAQQVMVQIFRSSNSAAPDAKAKIDNPQQTMPSTPAVQPAPDAQIQVQAPRGITAQRRLKASPELSLPTLTAEQSTPLQTTAQLPALKPSRKRNSAVAAKTETLREATAALAPSDTPIRVREEPIIEAAASAPASIPTSAPEPTPAPASVPIRVVPPPPAPAPAPAPVPPPPAPIPAAPAPSPPAPVPPPLAPLPPPSAPVPSPPAPQPQAPAPAPRPVIATTPAPAPTPTPAPSPAPVVAVPTPASSSAPATASSTSQAPASSPVASPPSPTRAPATASSTTGSTTTPSGSPAVSSQGATLGAPQGATTGSTSGGAIGSPAGSATGAATGSATGASTGTPNNINLPTPRPPLDLRLSPAARPTFPYTPPNAQPRRSISEMANEQLRRDRRGKLEEGFDNAGDIDCTKDAIAQGRENKINDNVNTAGLMNIGPLLKRTLEEKCKK